MEIYQEAIDDIDTLIGAIEHASEKFDHQVWWRGQRDYSWKLLPSIFRIQHDYDENAGILRFQQRAISRHVNVPHVFDRAGWLFLMQHYRLPTRLLDWTESPLVAAFFGAEVYECHRRHADKIDDSDGAIFALSPYLLNQHQLSRKILLMPEEKDVSEAIAPAFEDKAKVRKNVIAVRPAEVDIRLMVQLSVFTLNGFDSPIDDLKKSDQFLIKFRISKTAKNHIREDLKKLGIRLSTIFPDLDHLADEISKLEFKKEELSSEETRGSASPLPPSVHWGRTITDRGGEPST